MEPLAPNAPICYIWKLFREMGGLLAGPWVPECGGPERVAPHLEIVYFLDPSKSGSKWYPKVPR